MKSFKIERGKSHLVTDPYEWVINEIGLVLVIIFVILRHPQQPIAATLAAALGWIGWDVFAFWRALRSRR